MRCIRLSYQNEKVSHLSCGLKSMWRNSKLLYFWGKINYSPINSKYTLLLLLLSLLFAADNEYFTQDSLNLAVKPLEAKYSFSFMWDNSFKTILRRLKFKYYFLLPIYGRESIVLESNFQNWNFDGLTRFEVSWI